MIDFSSVKSISIPEGVVTKIVSAGKTLWQAVTYKNWVPFSVDTNGSIYNGVGYKDGYRLRSGGAESASDYNSCTGFIPCKAGDVIRFCFASGKTIWTEANPVTYINFYDASKTHLGQFTKQPAYYGIFANTTEANNVKKVNGVWTYTVINNANIAFFRMAVPYAGDGDWGGGADLIITINEEIT